MRTAQADLFSGGITSRWTILAIRIKFADLRALKRQAEDEGKNVSVLVREKLGLEAEGRLR